MKEIELPVPKKYKLQLTRDEYELFKKLLDEGLNTQYRKSEFPKGFEPEMIRIFVMRSDDAPFVDVLLEKGWNLSNPNLDSKKPPQTRS